MNGRENPETVLPYREEIRGELKEKFRDYYGACSSNKMKLKLTLAAYMPDVYSMLHGAI